MRTGHQSPPGGCQLVLFHTGSPQAEATGPRSSRLGADLVSSPRRKDLSLLHSLRDSIESIVPTAQISHSFIFCPELVLKKNVSLKKKIEEMDKFPLSGTSRR